MSDDFSNYKSAIEWPSQEGEDPPTGGDFQKLAVATATVIAAAAESYSMAGVTESPIETIFGARFALHARRLCEDHGWKFVVGAEPADISLRPQFPLQRFRYDFAILVRGRPVVLIECDGKDFHSSDEQLANDALKDTAAKEAGFQLLRFPGSQLHRDPDRCVSMAIEAMAAALR